MPKRTALLPALIAGVVLACVAAALAASAEEAQAAFPGQNGKILFADDEIPGVDNPEVDHEIFAANPDGTGITNLTRNDTTEYDPAWSPDGTKIAFTATDPSGPPYDTEVYIMPAAGGERTQITRNDAHEFSPTWAPDGSELAFVRYVPDDPATGWPDARQHLYAVPAGGGPEELLNGYFADSPAFSPDGTKVAFVGPDGLYTVPAGGGAATRVTSGAAWGGIDWSPDGTRIAYTAHTTQAMEDTEIRTVSAGGGAPTDLTDDAYDAGYADQKHPAWSPDGTTIAYQGTFGDIYTAGSGGGARPSKVAEDWRVQSELDWGADHGTPDATDPAITKPRPAPGAEVRDRTRTVAATVRDETTELAKADVRLFIDGARRAFSYDEATDKLSRTTGRLSYGKHRVRLEATDAAGNEATRAWSFRVVRGR